MAVIKKEENKEQVNSSIGGPSPWVFVLVLFLVYWGINYLDNNSGGFNAKVYAPHKNATAVANLKVQNRLKNWLTRKVLASMVDVLPVINLMEREMQLLGSLHWLAPSGCWKNHQIG